MWQIAAFVAVSAVLAYLSRRSLARPRSHGFYRFFAWELMLALFLLVVPGWFTDPFSLHQIASWVLLTASLVLLILGILALRLGQTDSAARADPALLGFEQTTRLVTGGIYGYIRHPLYTSLLLLDWGIFMKRPEPLEFMLALCAALLLVATARLDEMECLEFFGGQYGQYMKRTRMFIPYIF